MDDRAPDENDIVDDEEADVELLQSLLGAMVIELSPNPAELDSKRSKTPGVRVVKVSVDRLRLRHLGRPVPKS